MENILLSPPGSLWDWVQLCVLYRASFPPAERKPFFTILKKYRAGSTDVWCIRSGSRFLGFASTMNSPHMVMLDYLVIPKKHRGQGIGTEAMKQLMDRYSDRAFLLEIESPYEPGDDQILRRKRKAFYLNCGMESLHIMAEVFGVPMELLGKNCALTFEEYRNFYRDFYKPWAAKHILPYPDPDSWQ